VGHFERHWFFDQQMPLGSEHGPTDFVVPMIGHHDVDRVDVVAGQELPIVDIDRRLRVRGLGRLARPLREDRGGPQLGPRRLGNPPRRRGPKKSVADETETQGTIHASASHAWASVVPFVSGPNQMIATPNRNSRLKHTPAVSTSTCCCTYPLTTSITAVVR